MTEATIWQLIADGVAAALEAQATNMANTDRKTRQNGTPVTRTCNYKGNYAEENKVTFATGTLTNDALSWWNAYAQPIGIEQANKITWTELKRLLTNKYCPRTEVKKMEDEFYGLIVKGNDLKTYIRRFQELAVLCPNMVPNTEKLMEAFIGGLPQSIEGNVTASKPQTLEEATNIAQRLMDQILKHNSVQETNDHKRKFEDRRNIINNNNYQNNCNNNNRNNDHHQHQNGRQETFRTYGNHGYNGPHPLCRKCTLHHTGPCTVRKIKESLNVTFDETPPPSKTSSLVDDDLDEEEAIKVTKKKILKNDIEDETLEINEVVNIKESRNHPLENVIGNLNQRTLRSQAQNQSNFFCFISTIVPKNVNEALTDESWIIAMQEELNQFIANDVWELVPQPKNMKIIETKCVFRNKLVGNGIVSQNKARLVAQGYNQQEGIDYDETYASVARLESIRILLDYACALDFKLFQIDVKSALLNGFINEEKQTALAISTTKAEYVGARKMLYCIETSTLYNLAFFILKRMDKTRNKPKELLPYGMLLTRLFKHVVSIFHKLAIDHCSSYDRVMHPLALHDERKTRSDHGKKSPRDSNASSSSTTLNHPSSFHPLDDIVDDNDEESLLFNPFPPPQNISSSSNVVSRFL
ncbi:retrovirus-related pol polyprotein from transposon TNT 1-94 [Tanacetum coccineum]